MFIVIVVARLLEKLYLTILCGAFVDRCILQKDSFEKRG
jgi:hypothetical protein